MKMDVGLYAPYGSGCKYGGGGELTAAGTSLVTEAERRAVASDPHYPSERRVKSSQVLPCSFL